MTAAPPTSPAALAGALLAETEAIRDEPFSLEHLEIHARQLARALRVVPGAVKHDRFLRRIVDDARALREAHRTIAMAVNAGEPASVDAEWLLDNFSIVEEQLREIQEDLPRGYYHELPKTDDGWPRVYRLSLELIAHTDSSLDEETLVRFLQAFQEAAPLSIGETWAFPIMLRLALVENLRRIAAQMLVNRECRQKAAQAVAEGLEGLEIDFSSLECCAPLLLELLDQLEEAGGESAPRLREIERMVAERGWQPDDVARVAHRRQAANQVSIGNVITSMRLISALDWVAFFEQTNLAEQALRQDPAQAYVQMDPATRDHYRRELERFAKRSKTSDQDVARLAVRLAREAVEREAPPAEQHVGYYLIGPGSRDLAEALAYTPVASERLRRFVHAHPTAFYLGGIGFFTCALLAALAYVVIASGGTTATAWVMALLGLAPASELAVALMNLLVTNWLPPRLLPKFEFRDGVPNSHATLVVIPTLLTNEQETQALIDRLELHYLSNPEPALRFALLTDFGDAQEPTLPGDDALLNQAIASIQRLNEQYDARGSGPFYLFHRRRQWNQAEQRWMGWERKRGKLVELNRWLCGQSNSYETIIGDQATLLPEDGEPAVRYVITLDSDTLLPPGTARRMIGALAHPLNRPRFVNDKVVSGYVLLQPRLGVNLAAANRSWYSRIFANSPGIDPYSTAASDLYQDLFGEGSFTGKGIYDLEAFEKSLEGVFPENCILSHDLIEGCHTRVGLVSDIELIDGFPSRYDAEMKRQHRWVRGDWQLLPWLLPWVPSERGWVRNRLSWLSLWKVVDNLRRSLVPVALIAFVAVGWIAYPSLAGIWSLAALFVLGFPLLALAFSILMHWPRTANWLEYRRGWTSDVGRTLLQVLLQSILLPHRALSMLDAICRTGVRLITRRRLLEWETAAAAEQRLSRGHWFSLPLLWLTPVFSMGLLVALPRAALPAASLFLIGWAVAPLVGHWLNQPLKRRVPQLPASERRWLRQAARRTWSYFERFVVADESWLPPDNFQEYPADKVAHRVSPTNEGLFLLSALTARDFGFLALHDLVLLWERNLATWERFDRLHGHFYNWYDTVTLKPLHPRYVSTVDSGNLAAAFITLRVGIDELRQAELFSRAQWEGVLDTAAVVQDTCHKLQPRGARMVSPPLDNLLEATDAIAALGEAPQSLLDWHARMEAIEAQARQLENRVDDFIASRAFPWTDAPHLGRGLAKLILGLGEDFRALFPWLRILVDGGVSPQARLSDLPAPWPLKTADAKPAWQSLLQYLDDSRNLVALRELPEHTAGALDRLRKVWRDTPHAELALAWVSKLQQAISQSAAAAKELDERLERLAGRVESLAEEMDFSFLYNRQRRLFSIGFNIEDEQLDRAHYDMLASEARLASYVAIAKGDVEYRAWFHMGRGLVQASGSVGLVSWGGTMFEYLMPQLFQREYEGSLVSESCRMAVARQQEYGRECGIPWGVSESAFSALAVNSDYHYKSFGVPGLGLKRGLAKDLVVSPYSTFLALELDPLAACANLRALAKEGGEGAWGFYDAIDYTRERLPADKRSLVVRCYMAHHEGMSLLALANVLNNGYIRRLFHAHPLGRAGELLLQERMPAIAPLVEPPPESQAINVQLSRNENELVSRRLKGYDTATPRTHLLSNGHYGVMVTSTGAGYSTYRNLAVTRWRSDPTRDHWGQFLYLRDVATGRTWSATYQPTLEKPDSYHVTYSIDKAEFQRRDGLIETSLEVTVSPEHQAELRHLKIVNHGSRPIELEVTSYAEIVLTSPAADLAHPAFQKLFVETEYIPEETALLAKRRPRDASDAVWWGVHVLAPGPNGQGTVEYESSREQFVGRGRSLAAPLALAPGHKLTGSTGAVLDPVFSLRCRVVIPPHESTNLAFTTAVAASRDEAVALADAYHDLRGVMRGFELAWAFNQVQLRHLHISPAKAHLFQRLASALLYPDASHRADPSVLLANRQGQSALWRYGISGDVPILLAHITKPEQLDIVRDLLTAQHYWRERQFVVDLVLVNDNPGSYLDALQEQLVALVNEVYHQPKEQPPNVALLRGAQIPQEDQILLETAASFVMHCARGSLAKQLEPTSPKKPNEDTKTTSVPKVASLRPAQAMNHRAVATLARSNPAESAVTGSSAPLEFANGLGGFAEQGREYHLTVSEQRRPAKPWSNVLANPRFGCLITEAGGGYTWAENSREYKLTSWSNDPVLDTPSEWLYLRDERSQELLRPLPQAVATGQKYHVQHGRGYSRFLTDFPGLTSETTIFVAAEDPVKFIQVRLTNRGTEPRSLSLTYFAEWVLGVSREQTQLHVTTAWDDATHILTAQNAYHPELPKQTAFLHVSGLELSWTGDRTEFIGRNGSAEEPAALRRPALSGKTGAAFDPCGAVQTQFTIDAGQSHEIVILLGAAGNEQEVRDLVARYQRADAARIALKTVREQWETRLTAVQVRTPNAALDTLVNHWLLYQTIGCRLWARSAFYQSGGAYGFRDQLQDVMAVVYSQPNLAREQLLRAAAHQFEAGDVQHWWHPPLGRGTRTRFSDDYLWLALVTCHYLQTTGDRSVLDEVVPFLRSPPLEPHEQERYETPEQSPEIGTLYEHCRRTVARAFRLGPHGLPLMGCGDWNDGMNKVGELGQGESVWVGWFLLVILRDFLPLMQERGDVAEAEQLAAQAEALRHALETEAWDGGWYRRAYFDDGTPLGSSQNDECQIDSIAQTWAVFAAADAKRTQQAMEAVWKRLVRPKEGLVLLFEPAFDQTELDPGYIKGYLPGIRENGGQYTHPALWVIQAFAQLGDAERALEVFDLINPIHHGSTPTNSERYQVEPYVVAADVYGVPPHVGRGGWTWYTGSAAWMYRVALESLLGFKLCGNRLRIEPRVPASWPEFEVNYRWKSSTYHITVLRPGARHAHPPVIIVDGEPSDSPEIVLVDDGGQHEVVIGPNPGELRQFPNYERIGSEREPSR